MSGDPLAPIRDELAALEAESRRRVRRVRSPLGSPSADASSLSDAIDFSSNDYLGLSTDPRVLEAAIAAGRRFGVGAGASPLVMGYTDEHAELESTLAAFEGTEAALVFPSGFAANLGVVSALAGASDAVFGDRLNHASLIDGCRLSGAHFRTYRATRLDDLAEKLTAARDKRRRFIVTDSLFSMDGHVAPLAELRALAEEHDAWLIVDEAHATGVFGEHGRGALECLPPDAFASQRIVKIGTLSKGLGAQGGFVVGSRTLIELLVNKARSYLFSTALSPMLAAAARRAIEIVQSEPQPRRRLLQAAAERRAALAADGWNVGDSVSQIIPVIVGDNAQALALAARLRERGAIVPAIRPPTVPPGTARLRISLTVRHDDEAWSRLMNVLRAARADHAAGA